MINRFRNYFNYRPILRFYYIVSVYCMPLSRRGIGKVYFKRIRKLVPLRLVHCIVLHYVDPSSINISSSAFRSRCDSSQEDIRRLCRFFVWFENDHRYERSPPIWCRCVLRKFKGDFRQSKKENVIHRLARLARLRNWKTVSSLRLIFSPSFL